MVPHCVAGTREHELLNVLEQSGVTRWNHDAPRGTVLRDHDGAFPDRVAGRISRPRPPSRSRSLPIDAQTATAAAISHRRVQSILMLTLDTFVHARHGGDQCVPTTAKVDLPLTFVRELNENPL